MFTEFCCRSGGSNLNAGALQGSSTEPAVTPSFEYAAGNWDATTGIFTVAAGNPLTDGVAVGDFASVYAVGATVTGFVGRVTARDATTITVSLTVKAGTAPTNGTGDRTLRIGGAWAGPAGAVYFPLTLAGTGLLTNIAGDPVRINFKNDQDYSPTGVVTVADPSASVYWAGYTTAYGDQGRAKFVIPAASYLYFYNLASTVSLFDLWMFGDGCTYSIYARTAIYSERCRFSHGAQTGIYWRSGWMSFVECEFDNSRVGFAQYGAGGASACGFKKCTFHDCSEAGIAYLLYTSGMTVMVDGCQFYCNKVGLMAHSSSIVTGCDFYDNSSDGITAYGDVSISNSSFVANGGYGVNVTAGTVFLSNCMFGSGTKANTSGATTGNAEASGSITYTANETPWNDPDNGDFTLVGAACRGTGRGTFATYNGSANPTISKPDIGSAQRGGMFPTAAQVETGVTFGAAGTEYTGTFAGGGGYTYGDEDPAYVLTTATGAGTLDLSLYALLAGITWPALDAVDGGVQFGPVTGLEYEGTGMTSAEVEAAITAALASGVNVTQIEGNDATDALQSAAAAAIAASDLVQILDSMLQEKTT